MQLTERQAAVVKMRDQEGKTFQHIGNVLGNSRQACRTIYFNARLKIARMAAQEVRTETATREQRLAAQRTGRAARLMGEDFFEAYGTTDGEANAWMKGWIEADEYLAERWKYD